MRGIENGSDLTKNTLIPATTRQSGTLTLRAGCTRSCFKVSCGGAQSVGRTGKDASQISSSWETRPEPSIQRR